jgi:hypothetical protein
MMLIMLLLLMLLPMLMLMLFQGWLDSDLTTRHVEYVKVRHAATTHMIIFILNNIQVKAFKLIPQTPAVGNRAAVTTQVLSQSGFHKADCDIMLMRVVQFDVDGERIESQAESA